jgi:hypothetical protein
MENEKIENVIKEAEEMREYVEKFELAADGITTFGLINEEKTGNSEYFFEAMGILARDKDTENGEIIQYIPWKEFGQLIAGEAKAARAHLNRLDMIIEEAQNERDAEIGLEDS